MQEAVEDGGRDGGVFEDLAPVGDPAVGGQDDAAVFVAAADDLEEVAGGFAGHRQVAELVDDQDLWSGPEAHRVRPAAVDRGAGGAGDEVGGGGVVDAVAGVHGALAERDREHCLADAGRADQQAVGFLLDEPEGGEVFDEPAVEGGLRGEVELLERLVGGELRENRIRPSRRRCSLAATSDLEEVVQELGVARLLPLGGLQRRCELVGRGAELQVREM